MTQWFNFVERSSAHTIHVHNSAHSAARFCTYTAPVIAKLLSGCFSLAFGVRASLGDLLCVVVVAIVTYRASTRWIKSHVYSST